MMERAASGNRSAGAAYRGRTPLDVQCHKQ
jgi:hypothetical protein